MRITITLDDKLYQYLKDRTEESGESISSIVENVIESQLLEDLDDIKEANNRENEKAYPFDRLISEFKSKGLI